MAERNLSQHIDKISYAVGGILGLAILVIPFVASGRIDELTIDLQKEIQDLDRRKREDTLPKIREPYLAKEVRRQWQVGSAGERGGWISSAKPGLARVSTTVEALPAVHLAGLAESVALERDGRRKQPYLVVKGAMNEANEHVVIKNVALMRSVDDGEFRLVSGFKSELESDNTFIYNDYDVESGKTYSYKFSSTATLASGVPSNVTAPEAPTQESPVIGPTPAIPYEFSLKVGQMLTPAAGATELPSFLGSVRYWDYAKGQVVELGSRKLQEQQSFGDGRFKIRTVDPATRAVEVRVGRQRYSIKRSDEPFEVDTWEPIQGVVPEEEEEEDEEYEDEEYEEDDEDDEDEEDEADESEERAPKRTRKRRSFN